MRRYIFNGDISALPVREYDVLVAGSGIAGLYAALNLPKELSCALITKVDLEHSSSWLAQGGIAAVISPEDRFESHVEDTLKAGAGICNEEAVRLLVTEGPENIRELIEMNVPFDLNGEDGLQITREGGHSCRRIVHCGGDATGRETTRRLGEIALESKNIDVFFRTYLIDVLTAGGAVTGAVVCDDRGEPYAVKAQSVIIATGGIGALYNYTTSPPGAVGDGIAAAQRAGAVIADMEMVQFHPTTLFVPQKAERLFLISEAVRGEGGILRNHEGEAFMRDVHPMRDLAPRDIVTRAILAELDRTERENCFLDVSSMDEEFFARRFPTIFAQCRRFEIDVPRGSIPVRPAQHYLMGGVRADNNSMTCVDGLYACGEASCTGLHGGNRLASNSILECLVFGRRAARHIGETRRPRESRLMFDGAARHFSALDFDAAKFTGEIKNIMTKYAGAVRRMSELKLGRAIVSDMNAYLSRAGLTGLAGYRAYNMAQAAQTVFDAACARTESVGAHYLV